MCSSDLCTEEQLSASFYQAGGNLAEIAGFDGILEPDLIDSRVEREVPGNLVLDEDRAWEQK